LLVIFIALLVYGAKIPVFIEYIALHKIIFSPSTPTCAIRARHTLANFQSLLKFFYPTIQNSKFIIIPHRTLSEGSAKESRRAGTAEYVTKDKSLCGSHRAGTAEYVTKDKSQLFLMI